MINRPRPFSARSLPYLLGAGVAVSVALLPVAVQAGFQIRGAGIPQPPPMSGGALQNETTLAPIGMMPDASGQPTVPVTAVPIDAPAPVDAAPLPPTAGSDVLEGFGNDLPLVIALQQVAPPGYQFSFAPGTDLGQRVSWQGGKSWRVVASDMLAANGLTFEVRDDHVLVVSAQGSSSPTLQTAEVTPPATPEKPLETADIRRTKPAGLINRIRAQLSREETAATPQRRVQPQSAAEALTQDWDAAEQDATTVVATELTAEETVAPTPDEDLSPIALTMQTPPPPAPVQAAPIVRPPPAVTPVPASEAVVTPSWQAQSGATLRDVLQEWSGRAGVDLYWTIDYDYRLTQTVSLQGSFTDATAQVLDLFANARPRPYAQLHQSGGQPRTLVIKAYGVGE